MHPRTVRRLIRSGRLPATRVGRAWRNPDQALERLTGGEQLPMFLTIEEFLRLPEENLPVRGTSSAPRHPTCQAMFSEPAGHDYRQEAFREHPAGVTSHVFRGNPSQRRRPTVRVLIATVGATPQISTETLHALHLRGTVIDEVQGDSNACCSRTGPPDPMHNLRGLAWGMPVWIGWRTLPCWSDSP